MKSKNSRLFPRGFTLVELVVVITILAILGTIGFLSVGGYSSRSRDSNRLANARNISTALQLYVAKSGSYPTPDGTIGTGSIGAIDLVYKGQVGTNVLRQLWMSQPPPVDVLTQNPFAYAISSDGKYYQIAHSVENLQSMLGIPFTDIAYADGFSRARVTWNYLGYLKYASGSETWVVNMPSLIFNNTGAVSLSPSNTAIQFVISGDTNLPYGTSSDATAPKTPDTLVKSVTGNSSSTYTGVNVTNATASSLVSTFTGALLASFWGNIATVNLMVLGTNATVTSTGTGTATWTGFTFYTNTSDCVVKSTNSGIKNFIKCTTKQISDTIPGQVKMVYGDSTNTLGNSSGAIAAMNDLWVELYSANKGTYKYVYGYMGSGSARVWGAMNAIVNNQWGETYYTIGHGAQGNELFHRLFVYNTANNTSYQLYQGNGYPNQTWDGAGMWQTGMCNTDSDWTVAGNSSSNTCNTTGVTDTTATVRLFNWNPR